ncbi:MAG: erythromycin esterase family protein [Patescibacteria group bacterium]|nr:erythromycin esterase family protein [Patescibacteria group bacterium]
MTNQINKEQKRAPDGLIREALVYAASPLSHGSDLDCLLDVVGDARLVLLGEASHGTHEYYEWRSAISRRLIKEKKFNFIAVEGDWSDCYEVNRYVKGHTRSKKSAREVLHVFSRWPTWMWANWEVSRLVTWLREYNSALPPKSRVGFYGLDVYSLWDSLRAVTAYLKKVAPESIWAAERAYRCFEPHGENPYDYAHAAAFVPDTCENDVTELLVQVRRHAKRYAEAGDESHFNAEQNALVVSNAEHYYRTMLKGDVDSWNIRDRHMTETLGRIMHFYGPRSKAIVWAHNTHIGDARATDMALSGMENIGSLVRERHADRGIVAIGFGSFKGGTIAAHAWDAPMKHMEVPPAISMSWEWMMHEAFHGDRLIDLTVSPDALATYHGHRAIGVVYRPEYERGNYVPTSLSRRYDAFLYLDETHPLRPFHLHPEIDPDFPETFPYGV